MTTPAPDTPNPSVASEFTRFLHHMFIASFLAPALGGAGVMFIAPADDMHGLPMLPLRVLVSIAAGFILLVFGWFINIPLGLFTYVVCSSLRAWRMFGLVPWLFYGVAAGGVYGYLVAFGFVHEQHTLVIVDGVLTGLLTGLVLRNVWRCDTVETEETTHDVRQGETPAEP